MNMKADTMCSQKKKNRQSFTKCGLIGQTAAGQQHDKIICPQALAAVKLTLIQIKGGNTGDYQFNKNVPCSREFTPVCPVTSDRNHMDQ